MRLLNYPNSLQGIFLKQNRELHLSSLFNRTDLRDRPTAVARFVGRFIFIQHRLHDKLSTLNIKNNIGYNAIDYQYQLQFTFAHSLAQEVEHAYEYDRKMSEQIFILRLTNPRRENTNLKPHRLDEIAAIVSAHNLPKFQLDR